MSAIPQLLWRQGILTALYRDTALYWDTALLGDPYCCVVSPVSRLDPFRTLCYFQVFPPRTRDFQLQKRYYRFGGGAFMQTQKQRRARTRSNQASMGKSSGQSEYCHASLALPRGFLPTLRSEHIYHLNQQLGLLHVADAAAII